MVVNGKRPVPGAGQRRPYCRGSELAGNAGEGRQQSRKTTRWRLRKWPQGASSRCSLIRGFGSGSTTWLNILLAGSVRSLSADPFHPLNGRKKGKSFPSGVTGRWNDDPSTRAPPWRPRRGDAHPSLQQVTYQTSSNWEPLFASVLGVRSQTPVKSRMPQFAESDLLDLPDPFASEPKTHADLIQRQRFVLAEAEVETQDRRLS